MDRVPNKRKYIPSIEEFKLMAKSGNLIPLYCEILADMETPVSAFRKVGGNRHSYLLESVEGGEKWARYSFIGFEPALIFRSKGQKVELLREGNIEKTIQSEYPLDVLKELMNTYHLVEVEGLPRFFGGAVGYVSYDMVRFIERLPDHTIDDLNLYDSYFTITDTILVFDNLSNTIKIVCNAFIEDKDNLEQIYYKAISKIEQIIFSLKDRTPPTSKTCNGNGIFQITSNMSPELFKNNVIKAKEYITAGEIIQVVLSQRFQTELEVDPFNIYRALRRINPSPYMFYLSLDDLIILGASPEVLVRVEDSKIELRPIAGTRPRGKSESEDEWYQNDLLKDPKEIAEHVMLVDLGRNDVGKVSQVGTVHVPEFLVIEKYSHVMHIVSDVRGTLASGKDCFDVLKACFPAGTVSGAPKVRAMEIIEELEPTKRGPYAGTAGYFSFSGNMDFCIIIRTIVIKNGMIYFQAGAGIVADSQPENEYNETLNKAKAIVRALEMVKEGLE